MSSRDGYRVFTFTRGNDYSVDIVVRDGDIICFSNQTVPVGTTREVVLKFLDEAERAVQKLLGREDGVSA